MPTVNKLTEKQIKSIFQKFDQGKTQAEIARDLGVTRETIRLHLKKHGQSGHNYRWIPDRNDLLLALKQEASFQAVAQKVKISEKKLTGAIRYYSVEKYLSAAKSRWRKKKSEAYYLSRQGIFINAVRKLAAELGHTPRFEDLSDAKISHSTLIRTFGSLADAMIASGLEPNQHGRPSSSLPIKFGDTVSPSTDIDEVIRKATLIRSANPDIPKPKGNKKPKQVKVTVKLYYRDPKVVAWVLNSAKGICELCRKKGYKTYLVDNYLEVHHVLPLSSGGADTISNAVAVCETCHGKLHRAKDRDKLKKILYQRIDRLRK